MNKLQINSTGNLIKPTMSMNLFRQTIGTCFSHAISIAELAEFDYWRSALDSFFFVNEILRFYWFETVSQTSVGFELMTKLFI